MPTRPLTPEQRQAITTRDVSVALSAGAGCGKTHVLVERFLSHLDPSTAAAGSSDSADLRQLIAITFTDAAAREMRERIRGRCYQQLQSAEAADGEGGWLRLLREIDTARVGTIHSFCTSLLRAHAAEAGLDPTFGVLDQGDADVLQFDVIDDVLRERLAALDAETLDLASAYGLSRLKQQVAALLRQRHTEYFADWLTADADQVAERWSEWYAQEAGPQALRQIAEAAPIAELVALLRDISPKKPAFADARATLLDLLPKLRAAAVSEQDLAAIREMARVQGICTTKDWPDAEAFSQYRDGCKTLRAVIDQHAAPAFDPAAAREAARLGLALLRLTDKVGGVYTARKAALGMLDFDDLLASAYGLLTNPQSTALRERLADDLRLLLVDEFQDTDELQVALVKLLCGPGIDTGRLFFVGDFKQSIYRFRGAEPKVFRELRSQLTEQGRLPLNVNFRSQPAVLHFVNALFCEAFARGGDSYEPLRPCRPQATEPPAVEFLWTITPNKNTNVVGAREEARRAEARAIARRLRGLVDRDSTERPIVDRDSGQPRTVRLGDVAILFRALSDVHLYEDALREYELPYYLVGGHAFYAQQEIYDVLNLLRAVASTADELSLAGALRSPFFSLADESLFWLMESGQSLNAGLLTKRLPPELSAEERAKATAAAETIKTLREKKNHVPIAELLVIALARTGYDAVLLAEFLGERKLANLHKLMERARAADRGITDLDGFITQLAQFISQEPKEALAATLPENADVIRLMTIHHAKGLEFPLVVVPDLDRPPHIVPPCATVHRELGPLVPLPTDDDRRCATGMTIFAALERAEELEERKRLLYVAATRAADYLIFSSSLEDFDKPKSDWMKLVAERFDLQTGSLRGELPAEYELPAVRVVTEPHTDHQPVGRSRGPDVLRVLEEAHQLAGEAGVSIPPQIAAVPIDFAGRKQFAVSQLSGTLQPAEALHSPFDDDSDGRTLSIGKGRGIGTLVHEVLSRIDWRGKQDVAAWCELLAGQYVVKKASDVAREARELLERFATSPRALQLAQARTLHREIEFLLAWPPGESNADACFFRGYIDCLYQDAQGGWHLIDYKTDTIKAKDIQKVAKKYEMQIGLYALAAEQALDVAPAEVALYFLKPGEEHRLSWNEADRRRTIAQVNQALASATNPEP